MTVNIHQDHHTRQPFHQPDAESVLTSVESYWQDLRRGGAVPARLDIKPGKLDQALSSCFILERIAPGIAKVRIAGQALHDVLKMEPRGMPFSAFFTPDGRERLSTLVEQVFEGPTLIEVDLHAPRALGKPRLHGRLLMLPLSDAEGNVTRVFGCMVVDGDPGRKTRNFDIMDGPMQRMVAVKPSITLVSETDPTNIVRGQITHGDFMSIAPPRTSLRLVVNNA